MQMIDRANTISLWVATQIVTQEKITQRIKYLTHFIGIAEKCGELNNFNALFSIIAAGLSAGCVTRLKKTWAGLPPRSKETHKSLVELVTNDGNYKNYRAKLSTVVEEPCIPFLGIYLTDLTFIEEGNLDFVKGTNPPHINFTKRRIYANTISQILCYQKHDYSFHYVLPLGKLIDQIELPYNENDLFELSVLNEPKDL
ncbi:ras guanine nucleotide exchange factor J-like [Zophobas morio]|uniref:ras guanine nucleotide exchange factor J-like n=1 Tax=Zophobas morio TaxID=2755281 RepID=UPI00308274FA